MICWFRWTTCHGRGVAPFRWSAALHPSSRMGSLSHPLPFRGRRPGPTRVAPIRSSRPGRIRTIPSSRGRDGSRWTLCLPVSRSGTSSVSGRSPGSVPRPHPPSPSVTSRRHTRGSPASSRPVKRTSGPCAPSRHAVRSGLPRAGLARWSRRTTLQRRPAASRFASRSRGQWEETNHASRRDLRNARRLLGDDTRSGPRRMLPRSP